MPRRRFRLTMKRKGQNKKSRNLSRSLSDDYGTPTDEEWDNGVGFNMFVVEDDEKNEHAFRKGDVALILPHDIAPVGTKDIEDSEYWIGRIREIRALSKKNVWAKVQWYYKPEDVASIVKSFDTSTCGHYERIFSDHHDYVHVNSFSGLTSMTRFEMNDDRQKYIGEKDFYCRYDFEHRARRLEPRQKTLACKVCSEPYSPDDSDRQRLMHFCPRPSCRRFYHESCLETRKGLTEGSRTLHLIMTWPDEDENKTISDLLSYTENTSPEEASTMVTDFLDSLPNALVKVAEQPIVRGAAFKSGGVTGNISYVVQARRMIYEVLRGSSIPDDWVTNIDMVKSIVDIQTGAKKKPMPAFICPECESII